MNYNSQPAESKELPVLTVRDAARYRAVLLAKRDELAAAAEGAENLVPPANDKSGDLLDWARADTEAELQIPAAPVGSSLAAGERRRSGADQPRFIRRL